MIGILLACAAQSDETATGLSDDPSEWSFITAYPQFSFHDGRVDAMTACMATEGTSSLRDFTACCPGGAFVGVDTGYMVVCRVPYLRTALLTTTLTMDGAVGDAGAPCATDDGDVRACCPEGSEAIGALSNAVWCGWAG